MCPKSNQATALMNFLSFQGDLQPQEAIDPIDEIPQPNPTANNIVDTIDDVDDTNEPVDHADEGETDNSGQETVSDRDSYDVPSASDDEHDGPNFRDFDDESNHSLDELVADDDEDENRKKEVKSDLTKWAIECGIPRTHINKLLVILKKSNEFSFLPNDYRSLLKTARSVTIKKVNPGTYFHFGLRQGILRSLNRLNLKTVPVKIELFVNIDGIPLTKSSNSQFWPILVIIRGIRCSCPFVVGIYHGSTKPAFANEYLKDFIDEAVQLETEGIVFRDSNIAVSVSALICDLPARSFVTQVKSHTAYYGCSKCETKSSYYNPSVNNPRSGRVTYPQLDALPRTDQSFKNRSQPEHHNPGDRPLLEKLKLGLVSGVPGDPQHLTDLGVTRKLFVSWTRGKYRAVKLSRAQKARLAARIESIRSFIPNDFPRKLGPLDLLDKWKSTCFRLIKLRLGPVLLQGILPDNLYEHFLLFHVAMVLLSNETQCAKPEVIDFSSKLLKKFVAQSSILYGQQFVSSNVHNLIHLPADVEKFGNLDSFSAYPFENYLQIIKNLVRKSAKPLQQIVKRLSEHEMANLEELEMENENLVLLGEHFSGPISPNMRSAKQFQTAKLKSWTISCKKPDNCVYLNDKSVVLVENFLKNFDQVFIVGRQFALYDDLYVTPLKSSQLGINVVKQLGSLNAWAISEIRCKGFIVPSFIPRDSGDDCDSFVVSPLFAQTYGLS